MLAGVVDAVPWSLITVAGRGGIAEEMELSVSCCRLDREQSFPGEVGDVIGLGYRLRCGGGGRDRLDQDCQS